MHSKSGAQGGTESLYSTGHSLCEGQIRQRIRLAAGQVYRHGYFVWRGASRGARTRRPQPWGRRAIINACSSTGSVHRVAIVRTGVLWPTLVRWLVILIGGSSSEVHGRRLSVGRKRGACTRKVTGD